MRKWMIVGLVIAAIAGIGYYFWKRKPETMAVAEAVAKAAAEPTTDFPFVDTPAARAKLDVLWANARAEQVAGDWTQSDVDKLRAGIAEARGVSSWEELKRVLKASLSGETRTGLYW